MSQSDFVSRGQALVAAGQFQEAVKVCRLGLLGRPTTVEGRVVLGQALLALKRFDEVLAEMRVALELDHTSIAAQVLKGEALLRKGDTAAALETLGKARQAAPNDPRIAQLVAQAESAGARGPSSASHPAVGFVGTETKHYPNHGEEDSGGGYTQPTSLQGPAAIRRSSQRSAAVDPEALGIGDKSGTVEVDPELEGVEVDDADFDDLAAPPVGKPGKVGGARGTVRSSGEPGTVQGKRKSSKEKKPGGTAIRKAVGLPAGPLDEPASSALDETILPRSAGGAPTLGEAMRKKSPTRPPLNDQGPTFTARGGPPPPRGNPLTGPPPLFGGDAGRGKPPTAPPPPFGGDPVPTDRGMGRGKPAPVMPLGPPVPMPPTPAPLPPVPRIAAAMPTVAAVPQMPNVSPASIAAAARPTIAVSPAPSDQPGWAQQVQMNLPPPPMDAHLAALMPADGPSYTPSADVPALPPVAPPMRTGMRRRSNLTIALWVLIGAVVIGGGVFAGFQIRAMRLQKQIAAARDRATDLAKGDTWTAWSAARDSLAQIVGASNTLANRAALARARALIAYEFDDGLADAKTAVDELAGQGGSDGDLAAAYLALAQGDAKAAKLAADAALSEAADDPAALYCAGQAALLGGDVKGATTYLREAFQHDPRPLYGVGLARALAASYAWDEAAATLDRVLQAHQDHPAAVIARAIVLADGGRIAPGASAALELRVQVEKVINEGGKPPAEQARGVSPGQVAFANLALAHVDFARGDVTTARGDVRAAASVGLDDVRFAEETIDTLFAIGDLAVARTAAERALQTWPQSRRARIVLAEALLASGRANDALDVLGKPAELVALPMALAVRGQARLAIGDVDGARADFDSALKKLPNLEPALVGRAWLELQNGNVDEARKLVEPHVSKDGAATPAIATIYAAVLRTAGDPGKAKTLLERVVAGPPGPEVARAELELARVERELGNFKDAKNAYAEAIKAGSFDARVESGLLMIEDRNAEGGREMLEALLKDQGDKAPPGLQLEVARARMLTGDHAGAQKLLDAVAKLPNTPTWKLERERGRLAIRRGEYANAVVALGKALDGSGADVETLFLAADAVSGDEKGGPALAAKIHKLAPDRLKGQPVLAIVNGKLAIAEQKYDDAIKLFSEAHDALEKANAPLRTKAQANFGLAVAKLFNGDSPAADAGLDLAIEQDPSLFTAYLFRANIKKDRSPKLALELANTATRLDPDAIDGWALAGELANKLGDRKTLAEAIAKLGAIAPHSDEYKKLSAMRR